MLSKLILVLVALAGLCVAENTVEQDFARQEFEKFLVKYGKVYGSRDEVNNRFEKFKANLARLQSLNSNQKTATYAVDKFSDLSVEEFRQRFLVPKFDAGNVCKFPYSEYLKQVSPAAVSADNVPTNFDWRSKGAVTPVKDQGQCGSCWTFSTVANIEGQWFLAGNNLLSLSEQYIVDCSKRCLKSNPDLCNSGCGGGFPWLAYQDIIASGYIPTEAEYPYIGNQQMCMNSTKYNNQAKISKWTIVPNDIQQITAYLYKNGPLSITLNADLLFSYSSGIISGDPANCPNSGTDHAVTLVGYGFDKPTNMSYWIVKNSWGPSWGEQGYFRIQSDNGLCGTNACVTSSMV